MRKSGEEGGREEWQCGKKNTEVERWRSVVAADSGYQQPTRFTKQPALR